MGTKNNVRTIAAGKFKATCLALLDEIAKSGQTLVITKRGRPVAQLSPTNMSQPKPLLGSVKYLSAPLSGVDEPWDADA